MKKNLISQDVQYECFWKEKEGKKKKWSGARGDKKARKKR